MKSGRSIGPAQPPQERGSAESLTARAPKPSGWCGPEFGMMLESFPKFAWMPLIGWILQATGKPRRFDALQLD